MRFINPEEFDFVDHWEFDDKKYIASFFYKLKNSYPNIEDEEYVSYIKYRIFIEFKKKYGMTPKRFISLSARVADFHEGSE